MIDPHCHILPQLDDGPETREESLRMARFYVEDGITHVVATPHCHRYIHLLRADILPRVEQFNRELGAAGIELVVLPGSEIQVIDPADYRREFEAELLCHFGDGRFFTLLEFSWSHPLSAVDAIALVEWIRARGMTPLVAHPERYSYFERESALLESLVEAGAWLQITVDSLLGNNGARPQALGTSLLERFSAAVLATDAHNIRRCSGLSSGFNWVREHLGDEQALNLRAHAEQMQAALTAST